MSLLKIGQYLNSRSKEQGKKLLKEVNIIINYSIPDTILDKQEIRRKWAGYTSLHFATLKENVDLVNELLGKGSNLVKQGTKDGHTPLHIALYKKSLKDVIGQLQKCILIETLLSHQVKINNTLNPKCHDGVSHLHIACIVNHASAVEFFAKAKEPLDQPTNSDFDELPGYTPLHCAIQFSSIEAADILLQHGADVHVENANSVSCLHFLIQRIIDTTDILMIGMRTLCMPYKEEMKRLESIVKLVLQVRKNNGVFVDDTSVSTLHIACLLRDKSIVVNFLTKGVDVNMPVKSDSKFWSGWTPLHIAACFTIKIMVLLIENGANILLQNSKGKTAIDLCAKQFSPLDVHLILSMDNRFKDITMSDNRTKLSDILVAMNNYGKFHSFLQTLKDFNITIPLDSPIWAGYNLLHLSLSLKERTTSQNYGNKLFKVSKTNDAIESYNCTTDEEKLYTKRIELLLKCGCSVNQKNASGQTPIHLAYHISGKMEEVDRLLIHSDNNAVDPNGLSHLHIACATGNLEVVKKYLSQGADVNSQFRANFEWKTKKLMKARAKSTPLHMAVAFGHDSIVEYLLECKADVYARDCLGFTPIHLVRDRSIGKSLFKATPNLRDSVAEGGMSHLLMAVLVEDAEAVNALLLNGAQVDRVVEANVEGCSFFYVRAGQTPLLAALVRSTYRGSKEIIDNLLRAGASVFVNDRHGISALQQALIEGSIFEMVKPGRYEVESCGMTLLHVACAQCDIEWAERLLESGADVNARISDDGNRRWSGATPMYVLIYGAKFKSVHEGLGDFVDLLLKKGADVTLESNGETPLHLIYDYPYTHSAYNSNNRQFFRYAFKLLLASHKTHDVNPTDDKGISHFHFACVANDVATVTKFLDHGVVDINEPVDPLDNGDDIDDACWCGTEEDISGFTPLHFAMAYHSREVAYLLLERGADVNAEDAYGNKPLHVAIKKKFVDSSLIKTMLGFGADINAKTLNNETPLYCLLKISSNLSLQVLEFFLSCGCLIHDLDTTRKSVQGIIGYAMLNAKPTELLPILERLMRVDEVKKAIKNGFSSIQSIVAIDRNVKLTLDDYLNAIALLVNNGCDLDHQSVGGATALHAAVFFDNLEALNALLQLGADMNVVDSGNSCPFANGLNKNDSILSFFPRRRVLESLARHVWKMRFTGLDLIESNLICLEKVEREFPLINNNLEQLCQDELIKAIDTKICDGLTVRDFLSELGAVAEYPRMYPTQRDMIDKYFKSSVNLNREFPEFCGLLAYQYRKALSKVKLWQPAKAAVLCIYQVELPDLCLEAILRYLTNSEMKLIINLAKELN